jgi:hypothetical protein
LRESSRIHSNDEYFKARPQIDNHDRRNVFDAGYDRGWQAAQQQSACEIAELKEKLRKEQELLDKSSETYRNNLAQIRADNERLREAIKETIADLEKKDAIRKALSATSTQSLQAHDEQKGEE